VAAGYVVRVAVDGLDALEKLRGGVPDLIISDLNMPRMSGVELLTVVRHRFPQIPVIVTTGGHVPNEMPEGLGADAYYHKDGLGFDGLLQSVTELTREPHGRTTAAIPDNKPVRARWDGEGHYVIQCEDCLRSFSAPCTPGMRQREQWTTCLHCRSAVQFLTDDGDSRDPALR
jgi:CheY-like chemotaxis protein